MLKTMYNKSKTEGKHNSQSLLKFLALFIASFEAINGITQATALQGFASNISDRTIITQQNQVVPTRPLISKDFYTQLNSVERNIYMQLKANVYSETATIDLSTSPAIYSVSTDNINNALENSVNKAFDALRYDNPDIFWLDDINLGDYETAISGTGIQVNKLDINLVRSSVEELSQKAESDSAFSQLMSSVEGASRYDKLASLYVAVGRWMSYNYSILDKGTDFSDVLHSQQITSALLDRYTVCTGYAKTLKLGADALGIPAVLVSGIAYTPEGTQVHMWVMVEMEDGNWYALDPTWDDVGNGTIADDFFLVGSDTITTDGKSFSENHKPDKGLFSEGEYGFTYPTLSSDRYAEAKGQLFPASAPVAV